MFIYIFFLFFLSIDHLTLDIYSKQKKKIYISISIYLNNQYNKKKCKIRINFIMCRLVVTLNIHKFYCLFLSFCHCISFISMFFKNYF